jgi:hypothetical protein
MDTVTLRPHQVRLLGERRELQIKVDALMEFLWTDVYKSLTDIERSLLARQARVMNEYLRILDQRIASFVKVAA